MPEQIATVDFAASSTTWAASHREHPGLIRVRLPFTPAAKDERPRGAGWLSMFGGGRQPSVKSVSLALVELHLEKVPDARQSRLQISVVMRHGGDVKLISSPQWRPWCERAAVTCGLTYQQITPDLTARSPEPPPRELHLDRSHR